MSQTDKKETKKKYKDEEWGWGVALLMLLVAIFYVPIMWLAEKIKGNGVGIGPALASFAAATVLVLGTIGIVVGGILLALGIHFWGQ